MKSKLVLFCIVSFLTSSFIQAKVQTVKSVQSDIFYEIARGSKKSIKTWLESKPDLSIRNDKGQTVIHVAALTGQRDLVKMFVKAGAVINAVDFEGKTALDHAVEFGHIKMMCALIKYQGKVTTSDNLYHLKFFMTNRAFSLGKKFLVMFFVGGILLASLVAVILFGPLFLGYCGGWNAYVWLFLSGYVLAPFVISYFGYTMALPFRAWSWNYVSHKDWMLKSSNVVSLI